MKKRPQTPKPSKIEVPADDYEPSKEELYEDVDMPNLTVEEAKKRLMRPFRLVRTDRKKSS